MKLSVFSLFALFFVFGGFCQSLPSLTENVEYIATFGKNCPASWGDDDHSQVIFFLVPKNRSKACYIRVFDPDCGGKIDKARNVFNSRTKFSLYGGKACYSNKDARGINPVGNFTSGQLLSEKEFGESPQYDNKWYTFKALNPSEGEYIEKYDAYIFKLVVSGNSGDDGNMYKVFLSEFSDENVPVSGGNIFTYEYSFHLLSKKGVATHITPFVESDVSEVHINTFDFDDDGEMLLYSVLKNRHVIKYSGNNEWKKSIHSIGSKEQKTSLDIQIVKGSGEDNDMCIYLTNKYNIPIPIFSIPLGGFPVYPIKTNVKRVRK